MALQNDEPGRVSHGPNRRLIHAIVALPLLGIAFAAVVALSMAGKPSQPSASTPPNTTSSDAEVAAAKQRRKDAVVNDLAPRYCASHKELHLQRIDALTSQGFPMFDGVRGFSAAECQVIMAKLYELDPNKTALTGVVDAKVWIGMPWQLLVYSIGTPNDLNSTTTAFGNHQQWVYGDPLEHASYVYIDGGKVSAYQE